MSVENDVQITNPIDQLVGEGKKFRTVEDLVASYNHSQAFIEQIKSENAGLREELGQRTGAEDLFNRIVASRPAEPQNEPVKLPKEEQPVAEPASNVDLAQQIRETLREEQLRQEQAQNAQTVITRLIEVFGDEQKAEQAVKAKAAELGVSPDFLRDAAMKSPKAFFVTLGIEAGSRQTAPVQASRGDVNTAALKPTDTGANTPGTYDYYDALRKSDPASYWSPQVQNEIFKAAQAGTYKPKY